MLVQSVEKIKLDKPVPVYDIPNTPGHNFIIKGKEKDIVIHNCGLLDEVNFGKIPKNDKKQAQGQVSKLYESTKSRQQTRFSYRNGKVRGLMILVSSKTSDLSFLEDYINKVKDDPGVYIVDKPIWEVRPKSEFSKTTFKVAVADKNHQSLILPDKASEEDIDKLINEGYTIIDVPDNFKKRFQGNLERSIMDLAGMSVANILKFISGFSYSNCISETRKNPFYSEILEIGTEDSLRIQDYFDRNAIPEYLKDRPLFIHIDGAKGASEDADIMGISGVCQYGIYKKEPDSESNSYYEEETGEGLSMYEVKYMHLFSVGIKGPRGAQIDWSKVRSFIYWLRGIGFNIKGISIDGFQSLEMIQILTKKGFDVKQLSLDIKTVGWDTAKQIINERRVDILPCELLKKEVTELEVNIAHSKIDHPIYGSKDIADSFAGALWNAVLHNDSFIEQYASELNSNILYDDAVLDTQDRLKMQLMESLAKNGEQTTQDIVRNLLHKLDVSNSLIDVEQLTDEQKIEYNKQVEERKTMFGFNPNEYTPEILADPDIIII